MTMKCGHMTKWLLLVLLVWADPPPTCPVAGWTLYDWYVLGGTGEPNAAFGSRPLPASQRSIDLAPGKPDQPDCAIEWYLEADDASGNALPDECAVIISVDGETWAGLE